MTCCNGANLRLEAQLLSTVPLDKTGPVKNGESEVKYRKTSGYASCLLIGVPSTVLLMYHKHDLQQEHCIIKFTTMFLRPCPEPLKSSPNSLTLFP
jgi:hypothetical protein